MDTGVSKTVIFAVILITVGVANAFGFTDFQPTPTEAGLITGAIGIIVWVIRYFTSTPMVGIFTKRK